ncbi:hypothetical protein AAGS61_10650 [Lysinibacillus sp. KU-BSD001]|uniref:hypothetical protein n=1 Tax=Lysinibacillus sp. KU-BSD001 TaxID=3141328 RepID=UPI0036E90FC1
MISMLEKEHMNRNEVGNESEVKEEKTTARKKSKSATMHVSLEEVMAILNKSKSIEVVAKQLDMDTRTLKNKLTNAAIVQDDEQNWVYSGGNNVASLARNVYSKITIKEYDRLIVDANTVKVKDSAETKDIKELEFELYKKTREFQDKTIKKSVYFDEQIFYKVKEIKEVRDLKMGGLVSALVDKGLEYYKLK